MGRKPAELCQQGHSGEHSLVLKDVPHSPLGQTQDGHIPPHPASLDMTIEDT